MPGVDKFGLENPKQIAFLRLVCPDAFYGGSAGGGKSLSLCAAALQYADVPGYNALIIRRSFPMLNQPEGVIPTLRDWLRGIQGAEYSEGKHTWTFQTGGRPATLLIGHLEDESALTLYQGGAYHFIGMDEGTQFTEAMLRYMFSRLRKRYGSDIPLRLRVTANPGGKGHDIIKARYIDPHGIKDRITIRAALADNPYLDESSYMRSLEELDPITRRQILNGDWTAKQEGGLFKREWFGNPVELSSLPAMIQVVRFWDMAATVAKDGGDPDYTVGLKMGRYEGPETVIEGRKVKTPMYAILHVVRGRWSPQERDRVMRQTAEQDGRGVAQREEQEGGSSGKSVIDAHGILLDGYDFKGAGIPRASKQERAGPYSSACEAGRIKLVLGEWNAPFIDEHEAFPFGSHDDTIDGGSGAYTHLSGGPGGGWARMADTIKTFREKQKAVR